jgi:hypothetical protein
LSTHPEPAQGEGSTAGRHLRPLRDLAALILVAAPAVMLFVSLMRLVPSVEGDSFSTRAQVSFDQFINLASIALPLLAVLLATLVLPEHPRAKLITTVALVEYAVMAFFGILFGFLIGLIDIAAFSGRSAFEEFFRRGAWLAVFAIAAFAVFQVWRGRYFTPRPKPAPGMYGQPAPGQQFGPPQFGPPPGTPQQYGSAPPGYGQPQAQQPYGQPGWNQPPPPGQPGYPAQPAAYSSQPYGQPQSPPPAAPQSSPPGPFTPEPGYSQGAAPYSPDSLAPTSGPHGSGQSSDDAYGAAPGYPAQADATQVVSAEDGEHERTQLINPDRAGHGDHDPSQR